MPEPAPKWFCDLFWTVASADSTARQQRDNELVQDLWIKVSADNECDYYYQISAKGCRIIANPDEVTFSNRHFRQRWWAKWEQDNKTYKNVYFAVDGCKVVSSNEYWELVEKKAPQACHFAKNGNYSRLTSENANMCDKVGASPLSYAARWNQTNTIFHLISLKAMVDHRDFQGRTAVIEAAIAGSACAYLELKKGCADLHIKDYDGLDAYYFATWRRDNGDLNVLEDSRRKGKQKIWEDMERMGFPFQDQEDLLDLHHADDDALAGVKLQLPPLGAPAAASSAAVLPVIFSELATIAAPAAIRSEALDADEKTRLFPGKVWHLGTTEDGRPLFYSKYEDKKEWLEIGADGEPDPPWERFLHENLSRVFVWNSKTEDWFFLPEHLNPSGACSSV